MSYLEKLTTDMKQAMKDKDREKLSTIRMLVTDLKNEKIKLGNELTKAQEEVVLKRYIKNLEKEIEGCIEANRPYDKQLAEKELVLSYLPKQLTEDEIINIVKETIKEVGATSKKDMGKVMKAIKQKVGNSADMSVVSKTVQQQLN